MKQYASAFGHIFLGEETPPVSHMLDDMSYSTCFVICDTNTARDCLPSFHVLPGEFETIVIPSGEQHKNLEQCRHIWSRLIQAGADRDSLIINLGGGMICDLGGFAASCYQRGIRFIHVPTSVTAMTDAAIGGKLGVDFDDHKNYVGLFNAAQWLWVNPVFIRTLPAVEIRSGLAEVIKHAIIGSQPLWEQLERITGIEDTDWPSLLDLSIQVKLTAVEKDPFDRAERKALNFGHTIGHALESYCLSVGAPVSHGHAVAYGMMAESKMALNMGLLDATDFEKIIQLIHHLVQPPAIVIPADALLHDWMKHDKKVRSGVGTFALPDGIGSCQWEVSDPDASIGISWLREHVSGQPQRLLSDLY